MPTETQSDTLQKEEGNMSKQEGTMGDALGAAVIDRVSLLKRATPQMAYFKGALFGFSGTGKTFTSWLMLKGLFLKNLLN